MLYRHALCGVENSCCSDVRTYFSSFHAFSSAAFSQNARSFDVRLLKVPGPLQPRSAISNDPLDNVGRHKLRRMASKQGLVSSDKGS